MPRSEKFQFRLKHLLFVVTILSTIIGTVIYLYEPHLIEDGHYPITLDYTRTLEEMIQAGKYDWVNQEITSANFPPDQTKSGTESLEAVIVHLDKRVYDTEHLLKLMDRKGLRPATLPELLALGEQYPELGRGYWIRALGSRSRLLGKWRVPCLTRCGGQRGLSLNFWSCCWCDYCRFLAFRK